MIRNKKLILKVCIVLIPTLSFLFTSCDTSSGNSVVRNVSGSFSGHYAGSNSGRLVTPSNSGNAINSLNVTQSGDQLEAIDNNGSIYRGSIGSVGTSQANFTMNGINSAGVEATFNGNFVLSGASSNATSTASTMSGTYIEPNFLGSFYGTATVPVNTTETSTGTNQTSSIILDKPLNLTLIEDYFEKINHKS